MVDFMGSLYITVCHAIYFHFRMETTTSDLFGGVFWITSLIFYPMFPLLKQIQKYDFQTFSLFYNKFKLSVTFIVPFVCFSIFTKTFYVA